MKKTTRHQSFINKRLLLFLSILFAMGGIGLLSIALLNIHPYNNSISDWYGFLDFRHGIPVETRTNLKIGDTGIITYYKDGSSLASIRPDTVDEMKSTPHKREMLQATDSIFAEKKLYTKTGEIDKHVTVTGMQMNRAKLYLQTEKLWYRLYFSFPGILTFLVASYCFWLLAGFVSDIQAGLSFGKTNRRRLEKLGWTVLIAQGVYLLMDLFAPLFGKFDISFKNPNAGYHSHFNFQADPVMPFSPTWTFIAILTLILANAFRDGEILQEDKDLIV